jgi:hypothetical protein
VYGCDEGTGQEVKDACAVISLWKAKRDKQNQADKPQRRTISLRARPNRSSFLGVLLRVDNRSHRQGQTSLKEITCGKEASDTRGCWLVLGTPGFSHVATNTRNLHGAHLLTRRPRLSVIHGAGQRSSRTLRTLSSPSGAPGTHLILPLSSCAMPKYPCFKYGLLCLCLLLSMKVSMNWPTCRVFLQIDWP